MGWITMKGRHIYVEDNESTKDAINRTFGTSNAKSTGTNPAATAKGLNDLKKNGSVYGDKARETQNKCKQILNNAKEGTTIYAVKEQKSSGVTAYGTYSTSKGAVDAYRKMENNTWSKIQSYNGKPGNKRLTSDDMSLKVLYNDYKWYGNEKSANKAANKIEPKREDRSFYDTYNPKYK